MDTLGCIVRPSHPFMMPLSKRINDFEKILKQITFIKKCTIMNIEVVKGDITKIKVDAIVNAANTSLLGGGGVDGAIHRAGGKEILEECVKIRNRQGGCKVGEAVITSAGKLPAKFVIHTVGPVWNNGQSDEKKLLHLSYLNTLKIALDNKIESISFPNISTGIYRFPKVEAANIAFEAVSTFLQTYDMKVIFVCHDLENYEIYTDLIKKASK